MTIAAVADALTKRDVESDPGFRDELARYAHRGLTVIGYVEIVMTIVTMILRAVGLDYPHPGTRLLWPSVCFLSLGAVSLAAAQNPRLVRHSRSIGFVVGFITLILIIAADLSATNGAIGDRLILSVVTVLLVGVATMPLTPLLAILFNGGAVVAYAVGWHVAGNLGMETPQNTGLPGLSIIAGLCVFVSAGNYDRLVAVWNEHKQALAASEELRESELRICNAENASTNVRLAAALSHELNTPMGALKSAVNTVLTAAERLPGASPEKQDRLTRVIRDSRDVASEAIGRLESVVRRMQRFSNLDRAEVQAIDVAAMLKDIIELHAPAAAGTRIESNFERVPPLTGQPQALSAVFSTLLRKALDTAGPGGRVRLELEEFHGRVRVTLEHGRPSDHVDFDLGFAVDNDRVGAANWDLFSARQVIRAHGGEIEANGGSRLAVTLPTHTAVPAMSA